MFPQEERLFMVKNINPEKVLARKMPGAGGGGYLALAVKDSHKFTENHDEAIHLQIRRA